MIRRLAQDLLELGARVLEAPETLLEDRGAPEANGAQAHALGVVTDETRRARCEMLRELVVSILRDEERLDRDVGFGILRRVLPDLAPRQLRFLQLAARRLRTCEA